jgi:hypothetical protein
MGSNIPFGLVDPWERKRMRVARIVVLGLNASRPYAVRDPEEDQIRRSNSVNFVRYGVTSIQSAK